MKQNLYLIQNQSSKYHVSQDTITEFEDAISNDLRVFVMPTLNKYLNKINYFMWRSLNKIHMANILLKYLPWNFLNSFNKRKYLAILMGCDFQKCLSPFLNAKERHLYMFDAWPKNQNEINTFIKSFKIDNIFLSSSEAVQRLSALNNNCNFYWIPEAINPNEYKHKPYDKKMIDVIQLGRKYESYHKIIEKPLKLHSKIYLFEKKRGEIIFPDRKNFIWGLANSKISICVPSSITHPERSGNMETMTVRYLQSMVSKCLVVGHAPKEMLTLFDYNPVIEIDTDNPIEQIMYLLCHYDDYIPLIEKNYKMVNENHTWAHRWIQMSNVIFRELKNA